MLTKAKKEKIQRVEGAAGIHAYRCDHCDNMHLAMFDDFDEPVCHASMSDEDWIETLLEVPGFHEALKRRLIPN